MSTADEPSDQDPPSSSGDRRLRITVSGCPEGLPAAVRRAARKTLRSQGCHGGRLDIAVLGEAEMRRQHTRWMGRDSATDVLAFDLRDEPRVGGIEGQLLVCRSVARRRARSRNTDWRGELLLYVVHGCLHLCGHDDRRSDDAARMHRLEDEILTALGWGPVFSGRNSKHRDAGTSERPRAEHTAATRRTARPASVDGATRARKRTAANTRKGGQGAAHE